jgi:DNA-binding protein Fis
MTSTFEKYLVTIMVFLICFVISVLNSKFTSIIYPATAQTIDTENMTAPMMESARFHLKAADELLMKGDTTAALDQINLAEIQLSLLNMGFQETSMNQTKAMEFIIGGSLSSMRMAANCIIDSQAMVRCME